MSATVVARRARRREGAGMSDPIRCPFCQAHLTSAVHSCHGVNVMADPVAAERARLTAEFTARVEGMRKPEVSSDLPLSQQHADGWNSALDRVLSALLATDAPTPGGK